MIRLQAAPQVIRLEKERQSCAVNIGFYHKKAPRAIE